MGCGFLVKDQRHRLARLPSRAGDEDCVARGVVVIVGLEACVPIQFRALLPAAARHQQEASSCRRRAGRAVARDRKGSGRSKEVTPWGIQLGGGQVGAAGDSTDDQYGVVCRKQKRQVEPACRRQAAAGGFDHGGIGIVDLGGGKIGLSVASTNDQNSVVEEPCRGVAGARRRQAGRRFDRIVHRIVKIGRPDHTIAVAAAGDEDASVLQAGRNMDGPARGHARGRSCEAVVSRVEDLQRAADAAFVFAARHKHPAVVKKRRGVIESRLDHPRGNLGPGIRGRVVNLRGSQGDIILIDATHDENTPVGKQNGCMPAPRARHGRRARETAIRVVDLGGVKDAGAVSSSDEDPAVLQSDRARACPRAGHAARGLPNAPRNTRQGGSQGRPGADDGNDDQTEEQPWRLTRRCAGGRAHYFSLLRT